MEKITNKKTIFTYLAFFVLLASSFIFSLYKIKYGFPVEDEAFYLTIPQRILQGDALIKSEWHISQLFSILLVPFVFFYQLIFKTNDGIIFGARMAFVAFHAIVSILIFISLDKKNFVSMIGVLLFFAFSPYYMMCGNYYSLGIDFLALAFILYVNCCKQIRTKTNADLQEDDKQVRNYTVLILKCIISGIFFSASVLCCPYLAIAYLVFAIIVIFKKKINKKAFGYFSIGVLVSVTSFLTFIFSRMSFNDLATALPFIMGDPEHNAGEILFQIFDNLKKILLFSPFSIPCIAAVVLSFVFAKIYEYKRNLECFIIASIAIIVWQASLFTRVVDNYNNYINLPIVFLGLMAYVLSKKKSKYIFVYCLGVVYSFCLIVSSNLNLNIFASGLIVSCLASFVMLGAFLEEINFKLNRIIVGTLIYLMCAIQVVLLYNAKANFNFWDEHTNKLDVQITSGPVSGIITSWTKSENYKEHLKELNEMEIEPGDKVLLVSEKAWIYLYNKDLKNVSFSAWQGLKFATEEEIIGDEDSYLDRLNDYYNLNLNKYPDKVYVDGDLPLSDEGIEKVKSIINSEE